MALTLESPWRTPERILTFGTQGTGKSHALLTIARLIPSATFHVIDADMSESYARALDMEFTDLTNVVVHRVDPDDFTNQLKTLESVAPKVQKNDWLVFDSVSVPWPAVQAWYFTNRYGMDEDEFFMAAKKGQVEDDGANWTVINKRYFKLTSLLFRTQGHLYLTAEAKVLGKKEEADTQKRFGSVGAKPSGQKSLGHMPNTVLYFEKMRTGMWQMTTVKDRNRVELARQPFQDFGREYLLGVAGWKRRPVADEMIVRVG